MRVKKIAQVARIHLNEEEYQSAEQKLNDVYEWIKSIKEINVDGVLPATN